MSGPVHELTGAKRRLLERLKRTDSATAPELAAEFGLTDTALRQHLEALESAGLVERTTAPAPSRGRPPVHWRLAPAAHEMFPDRHGDLTVDLIASIREAVGDDGLDRVVATRAQRQIRAYTELIPGHHEAPVDLRVRRLADVRSAEGYLAEVVVDGDDLVLVEHHCPIQDAAGSCGGLCEAELAVFRGVLGPDVRVDRESHLLSGDRRCSYRVSPSG
jgi:predicted ArsR family transcriptional regulator